MWWLWCCAAGLIVVGAGIVWACVAGMIRIAEYLFSEHHR